MHTTGFNIRGGIRHIEEDNVFPAWLALETATMFFHGFVAGWAQRCHCSIGTPETAIGSNGLGQPNALRFAFDLRVLDLRRTHDVFGGQFSQLRLRVMVGHVAGVPLAGPSSLSPGGSECLWKAVMRGQNLIFGMEPGGIFDSLVRANLAQHPAYRTTGGSDLCATRSRLSRSGISSRK